MNLTPIIVALKDSWGPFHDTEVTREYSSALGMPSGYPQVSWTSSKHSGILKSWMSHNILLLKTHKSTTIQNCVHWGAPLPMFFWHQINAAQKLAGSHPPFLPSSLVSPFHFHPSNFPNIPCCFNYACFYNFAHATCFSLCLEYCNPPLNLSGQLLFFLKNSGNPLILGHLLWINQNLLRNI